MQERGGKTMANELVRQQNKQNVLYQAMKLFVRNGVENTSLEMIARESKLTLRSVQNYFRTKNDLISAVLFHGQRTEMEEMKAFFDSEEYRSRSGAEQIMSIVKTALDKSVEKSSVIFCISQMHHILSRVSNGGAGVKLTENWLYVMKQLQNAFNKGARDGSIAKTKESELIDVKTIMLAVRGIQEQVAFAMNDAAMKELIEPEKAVTKYKKQIELLLMTEQEE